MSSDAASSVTLPAASVTTLGPPALDGPEVPEPPPTPPVRRRGRGRRGHRVLVGGAPAPSDEAPGTDTRERILDVALDLFIEKGFQETSLREIAERLGVTKAALYYHFPSKDDILITLHLKMHDLIRAQLTQIEGVPASRASWAVFLEGLVDTLAENGRIFLVHQRNISALGEIHRKDHGGPDTDPEQLLRGMMSNPALSLDDRVRMAAALAAIGAGATMLMQPPGQAPDRQPLSDILRAVVRDLLP